MNQTPVISDKTFIFVSDSSFASEEVDTQIFIPSSLFLIRNRRFILDTSSEKNIQFTISISRKARLVSIKVNNILLDNKDEAG